MSAGARQLCRNTVQVLQFEHISSFKHGHGAFCLAFLYQNFIDYFHQCVHICRLVLDAFENSGLRVIEQAYNCVLHDL